jgi:group I intron endonuclease
LTNGKMYIGQTSVSIEKRFKEHISHSLTKNGKYKFHQALRKYGAENFTIEEVMWVEAFTKQELKQKLDYLEKYFIQRFDTKRNGYNSTDGGEGMSGSQMSIEWRNKISEALKGHPGALKGKHHSEESKKLMSRIRKGKHLSEETKQRLSEAHKGKVLTEECKDKLRKLNLGENNPFYGKKHSEETKAKMRLAKLKKRV